MAHASSGMNLPLALLIFLLSGVVLGSSSAPAAFDWRNNNGRSYVTSVKNQGGRCDNSWAFAAVSVVESALLIKGGTVDDGLDLSEQQVLDCGSYPRDTDRYGCYHGTVDDALRFITTRGGLSRERDYHLYTGLHIHICQQPRGSMVSTQGLTSYLAVDRNGNEDQLAQALATHDPVAVTICKPDDMILYKGGIYDNPYCCKGHYLIRYPPISMTLVGYGTQDGIPYWTLKNSWGRAWGEDGYIKLARGSSSAPAAFDWRNNNGTNYVTSVKNEGGLACDNSWAFAAVSVVESALLIKGRGPEDGYDLSEQQVLDCGSYQGMMVFSSISRVKWSFHAVR